jgi:hypothetical protein
MTLPSTAGDVIELDPPVEPFPPDTMYLGSRLDQMVAELNAIRMALLEGERPRPTLIYLTRNQNTYRSSVRLRVERLIIADANGDKYLLQIGSHFYQFQGATQSGPVDVPFPITVEAGVDITVTVTDKVTQMNADSSFFIVAYPDGSDD